VLVPKSFGMGYGHMPALTTFNPTAWALILGGSSGIGLAATRKLAAHGMNVAVVHRDRRGAMAPIEAEFAALKAHRTQVATFNVDALSTEGRKTVLDALALQMAPEGKVRVLLHSIAFGNLKLLAPMPSGPTASERARSALAARLGVPEATLAAALEGLGADADALADVAFPARYASDSLLEEEDFAHTVAAMGTNIATWTQDVLARGMFAGDARVIGLTSEGNEVAWRGYAAVGAAKVALESVVRAMAVELAPYGIRANVVQAGVTDTPALRLIPGSARLKAAARHRNPFGRLTTPQDVADVVYLLCTEEARWINGTIVRADGGEHVSG
jgi:NAD(P)-dependent dehydrogenase (short-subunit alcohol dehydrogenase family)